MWCYQYTGMKLILALPVFQRIYQFDVELQLQLTKMELSGIAIDKMELTPSLVRALHCKSVGCGFEPGLYL